MGRVAEAFAQAREEHRAALVIYLCAGDPDLAATEALLLAIDAAGADVIELGVPFSDPTADGGTIQRASERALASGTTLRGVLEAVGRVRAKISAPIVLFGYYNPILKYGEERLVQDAQAAGIDGFLVVDLPPEECPPLREPAVRAGLDYVPLVAPTSRDERISLAGKTATSFIYYVSFTGVTGSKALDTAAAAQRASEIRDAIEKPVALGFGIQTPEQVREAAAHADGVVVGSAIVRRIEDAGSVEAATASVSSLVSELASATRNAST